MPPNASKKKPDNRPHLLRNIKARVPSDASRIKERNLGKGWGEIKDSSGNLLYKPLEKKPSDAEMIPYVRFTPRLHVTPTIYTEYEVLLDKIKRRINARTAKDYYSDSVSLFKGKHGGYYVRVNSSHYQNLHGRPEEAELHELFIKIYDKEVIEALDYYTKPKE